MVGRRLSLGARSLPSRGATYRGQTPDLHLHQVALRPFAQGASGQSHPPPASGPGPVTRAALTLLEFPRLACPPGLEKAPGAAGARSSERARITQPGPGQCVQPAPALFVHLSPAPTQARCFPLCEEVLLAYQPSSVGESCHVQHPHTQVLWGEGPTPGTATPPPWGQGPLPRHFTQAPQMLGGEVPATAWHPPLEESQTPPFPGSLQRLPPNLLYPLPAPPNPVEGEYRGSARNSQVQGEGDCQ